MGRVSLVAVALVAALGGGCWCRHGRGRAAAAGMGSSTPANALSFTQRLSLTPRAAAAIHPTAAQKDTPQPTDADVKVVEYDSITVYVRVFSGFATEGALGRCGVAGAECGAHACS